MFIYYFGARGGAFGHFSKKSSIEFVYIYVGIALLLRILFQYQRYIPIFSIVLKYHNSYSKANYQSKE